MVELLAPAGNLEKIKTAINYGADAVYSGLKRFGLRSRAKNLSFDEYIKALEFVREKNKKLYLTLNAYLFDKDFEELKKIVGFLNRFKPDGVIVSDLGVLSYIYNNSDIDIHISTQANITNSYAAKMLKRFRVKRVILARELSIDDIKDFKRNCSLELEAFVHGAMCMAYSGRCFMSAFMTKRSANRGDCAQSCRWRYTIVESKRPNEHFEVEEHPEGSFVFNSCDLCALPVLDELIKAGVSSLKIEGRMKSIYYVAVVVAVYRDALNTILSGGTIDSKLEFYLKELERVSHRPYCLGFYKNDVWQYTKSSGYIRNCRFVGVVEEIDGNVARVAVRDRLSVGEYEVFGKDLSIEKITVKGIFDRDGNEKKSGNPNEIVYIKLAKKLNVRGLLRVCHESNSRSL